MSKKIENNNNNNICTIYIVTDGVENASRTFTRKRIKELVKAGEKTYNIKVIYLAANQDAILEAGNLGINAGQAINYSESREETQAAYRSAAAMVGRHRSGGNVEFLRAERSASQRSGNTNTSYSIPPISTSSNPSSPLSLRLSLIHI